MQEAKGELIPHPGSEALVVGNMPTSISAAGAAAAFAWEEFFSGKLRNLHTRAAYLRAVRRFLAWAESHKLELPRIMPGMMGRYFDELPLSIPSKKLDLAAKFGSIT
jgi:hypothetical protein